MEDSSLSESELENKGTSGRNEPAASPAGFSPSSEVHIVSFHGCFSFPFSFIPLLLLLLLLLRLSAVHLPPFLCLSFTFALWPWDPFKMPPSSSSPPSLSDSSDGSECPSFCLSLSLHSLHSLSLPLSLSLSPSLTLSLSPSLIRYTDSSFQWTSFKRRLLP